MGTRIWSDDHLRREREALRQHNEAKLPRIGGKILTDDDIGRNVTYVPNHAKDDPSQWERGKLSSFREDGAIFVRFKGPNGERCNPTNLRWG